MDWGSSDLLFMTARTSGVCSILGSGGCIFLFFYFKWWKVSNHHIILFHLSCSDILYSTFAVVGKASYDIQPLCDLQGWILQACGQMGQMWCTVIGINLLLQMVLYWTDKRCRTMMRWYMLVIYGTGIMTASVTTFRGLMEPTGTWCWVGSDWPVDRMAFFYAPLWMLFIANVFIVAWILRAFGSAVKKIPKEWDNRANIVKHYRWVTFHTSMFVVVGMLIWLPGTVYRIWQIVEETPPYWLIFLQKVLTPSQGILNFLLYVTPMWHKALADNREQTLRSNELQLAKIKTAPLRKASKSDKCHASLSPSTGVVPPQMDVSSDEGPSDRELRQNELTRSRSMPPSFGTAANERRTRSTSSFLRRSGTQHHLLEPSTRGRKLNRLQASYNFHNYSLVEVDSSMVPVWQVQKAKRKGPKIEV